MNSPEFNKPNLSRQKQNYQLEANMEQNNIDNDSNSQATKEASPNSANPPRPLPPYYYEPAATKDYFVPNGRDDHGYVRVRQPAVRSLLTVDGYEPKKRPGEAISEVDELVLAIQTEHNVDYVGPLAGYKAGYYPEIRALITSSPTFIDPCPGQWPVLKQLMENLFGAQQLPYVYAWLKVALEQYRRQIPLPGQAFVMCGPADSGKNLFRLIISILLGGEGRVKHPYQYMTGGTTFNSDMFGGETLAIEDESESRKIDSRRKFGANIKMIVANQDHRHHRKYAEPVTVRPLWRLIISLNDDPERLMVLPPMDDDIADKVMLFKVEKHPMPMPTESAEQRAAFKAALVAELPAFVHYLDNWEIPLALRSARFGVKQYHHPDVIKALDQTTPEFKLLEMIDEVFFDVPGFAQDKEGGSEEIGRELKSKESPCAYEARKLLEHPGRCGIYLGRLSRKMPDRISSRIVNGRAIWTIKKPVDAGGYNRPAVSSVMRQRLLDSCRTGKESSRESLSTETV
jgi:hypothetical protein